MTVKELIEKLRQLNADDEVVVVEDACDRGLVYNELGDVAYDRRHGVVLS